jgi:hypothetical protein
MEGRSLAVGYVANNQVRRLHRIAGGEYPRRARLMRLAINLDAILCSRIHRANQDVISANPADCDENSIELIYKIRQGNFLPHGHTHTELRA